jgi:hypothetical protein
MFLPTVEMNQPVGTGDVNKTVYKITLTMKKNGTTYTSTLPITYAPETTNLNVAPVPEATTVEIGGTGQNINTRYYYVYTMAHWMELVNNTFQSCWNSISTQAGGGLFTNPPVMYWNPTTKLFTLYCDNYGYGGSDRLGTYATNPADDEEWYIYFNTNMSGLFGKFDNDYTGAPDLTNKLIVTDYNGLNTNTSVTPPGGQANGVLAGLTGKPTWKSLGYYTLVQDFESVSTLWSPCSSIVFCSNLLPVVNELTANPVRANESNFQGNASSASNFQPIVSDLAVYTDTPFEYTNMIFYSPSAEYRLSSFARSSVPINAYEFTVFWKHRLTGDLIPLRLYNLSSVHLKVMFMRKGAANPQQYGKMF